MKHQSPVTGLEFSMIYADDLEKTKAFYEKFFGFEEKHSMEDGSYWGTTGKVGMWIGGGYKRTDLTENSTRSGVMFNVYSVGELFNQLKEDKVRIIQEKPVNMQKGIYWIQFEDPAGNIIEVLGGE